jgi:2-oxoglutarate dehydrogenase E2 component (dihydrolipoamide succinyltransferase)
MSIEIKVPALPESVSSATVANWEVKVGDTVKREQNLVGLETDKVVLDVPALADGVITEIRAIAGATVKSGDVIGILSEGSAAAPVVAAPVAPVAAASEEPQSPAVRKLLAEQGLTAAQVGSGRLSKEDVLAFVAKKAAPAPAAASAPVVAPVAAPVAPIGAREETRVPMTRIRQRIAERLVEAQATAAMLTTFNEVDLLAVNNLRAQFKDSFEKTHGAKLGFMGFFVAAAIEALKRFPAVNASIDGQDIVYHSYYDIGIAVSSPRGLVVPIVRDADALSVAGIEKAIAALGAKAKDNKLSIDDLSGGTFSITNGGIFGSMMSTPILNPPQSAILGMHGINDRPVVVNGQIVIRPMMYLALTYDHRIIDGREAVLFLRTIKECLEEPARLLLHV